MLLKWKGVQQFGKEYNKAVFCHATYFTYMQSTS